MLRHLFRFLSSIRFLAAVIILGMHAQPGAAAPSAHIESYASLLHGNRVLGVNVALFSMHVMVVLWVFVLGACFGSFLNVVIYRLPAGMSLGRPKSRCPRCETSLSARDNVPVLGWIMLRGKCRYCDLPIAPRYPIVEAACGGVLLALLFGELLTGAANLPQRHPDHFHVHPGFWLVWFAKWDLSGIYAYHCCLSIVTFAALMIGYDRHRPQWKLVVFGLFVAVVFGTMFPEIRPVAAQKWSAGLQQYRAGFHWGDLRPGGDSFWIGVTLTGLVDGVIGLVVGVLAGRLLQFVFNATESRTVATIGSATCLASVFTGAYLGWQGAAMFAFVSLPLVIAARFALSVRPRWFRALAPILFVWQLMFLLLWAHLDESPFVIGISGWPWTPLNSWQDWTVTALGFAIICLGVGVLQKPDVSGLDSADKDVPVLSEMEQTAELSGGTDSFFSPADESTETPDSRLS